MSLITKLFLYVYMMVKGFMNRILPRFQEPILD